jgi:poly(A) polymerase
MIDTPPDNNPSAPSDGGLEGVAGPPPKEAGVGTLTPQPWMRTPETRAVLDALSAEGAEVRFIGGCVRDAILKRPIRDIDIALAEPPRKVMRLLEAAGIKAIPTGIDHGTVTAVVDKQPFEITTLRVDVETDGRWARVAYTDNWSEDAARRDFTINALSCTPDGCVYDYFNGLQDLSNGLIQFVGDPRDRIREDRLRLLRFFRFYAYFGRPPPDIRALNACREAAPELHALSGERVRVEIFRTLMAPDPADVFLLMRDYGVLHHVLPEAGDVGRLRMVTWLDSRAVRMESVRPDPVRRLAALLETDAAGAGSVAERLKMSNAERQRLATLVDPRHPVCPEAGEPAIRRALHRVGADRVRDLALLTWGGKLTITARLPQPETRAWIGLLEAADAWTPVAFPLRGRDVMDIGVERGPRIGELLEAVERWWEEGDYRATRQECLRHLERLISDAD